MTRNIFKWYADFTYIYICMNGFVCLFKICKQENTSKIYLSKAVTTALYFLLDLFL